MYFLAEAYAHSDIKTGRKFPNRVTKLGEFSPLGKIFAVRKIDLKMGYFLAEEVRIEIDNDGLGRILGDFS
jgi:hypothetical protein